MSSEALEHWTDQELVRHIRAQHPAALIYVQRYFDTLARRWRVNQGNLPDSPLILAEQARDSAFQKAIQRIETFAFQSSLRTWMRTIFQREIGQLLRRFRGSAFHRGDQDGKPVWSALESLESLVLHVKPLPVDDEPSAAVLVLRMCLERLKPEDQEVLRTMLLPEPDWALAAQLGVTPEALRKRRQRALQRFKDCFLPQMPSYA